MSTPITASEARLKSREFKLTGAQVVAEYEGMISVAKANGNMQVGKTFPGHAIAPAELEWALLDFRSRGFEAGAQVDADHVRITVKW